MEERVSDETRKRRREREAPEQRKDGTLDTRAVSASGQTQGSRALQLLTV